MSLKEENEKLIFQMNQEKYKSSTKCYKCQENIIKYLPSLELPKEIMKKSIDILEGSSHIFSIFDSKRVLKFDIEYRSFKLIEFADFGNFEDNYFPQGSLYMNISSGIIIISGENHDIFFYYDIQKNCINKICKLNDNHSYGGLIFYQEENAIICSSGWHNKKVEKYINPEYEAITVEKKENNSIEMKISKTWTEMPCLTIERAECPYLILNNDLFTFFGFNCPTMKYLDSIEKIDLKSQLKWETVKFSSDKFLSNYRKSHSCVKLSNDKVLFVGGYDGMNEIAIENFSFYSRETNSVSLSERKLPDIVFNHIYSFQKNLNFIPFTDDKNSLYYINFDEKENIHSIQVNNLQYDIFKFED